MKMWWGGLALRSFNKGREAKVFRWVTRYLGVVLPLLFAEAWSQGFPGGSAGKESACSAGDVSQSWAGKICWRRAWQPSAPSLL